MIMNVPVWQLVLTLLAGVALGLFYFGGLWWTVKRSVRSGRPHAWSLASFAVRIGVFALVIVLLARHEPVLAIACFLGFVLTRFFILARVRPGPPGPDAGTQKER
jgi:F1F0 ATPase subunit 2